MRTLSRVLSCFLVSLLIVLPVPAMAQRQALPIAQTISVLNFSTAVGSQTNQTVVTITAEDNNRNPIAGAIIDVYFSDSPSGIGVTATASSGTAGLNVTSPAGVLLGVTAATPTVATSRVPMRVMTGPLGTVKVGVIDSGKTLNWLCGVATSTPRTRPVCATQFTAANYL